MRRPYPWSVLTACVILFACSPLSAQSPPLPFAIVLEGAASPVGGVYSEFYAPVLNQSGQVAFRADLTGAGGTATTGLFTGTAGSIQTVAVRGGATPAGGTYTGPPVFRDIVLSDGGQVGFRSGRTGGGPGIFAGAVGSVQTVAINGTASPAGPNYTNISTDIGVALNAAGKVAFAADLTGGPPHSGVFAGTPGSIQPVAVNGGAPPTGAAGTYISFSGPRLNASGQVAFGARLEDGVGGGGVFLTSATGTVQTVAAAGTLAPAGGTFTSFGLAPEVPSLNSAGQVAFTGSVVDNGNTFQDLVVGGPGSLQAVARSGTAAPGGGTYSVLDNPILNDAGQVAFIASVRQDDGSGNRSTLFVGAPGDVHQVAQQSTAAPGGGDYFNLGDPALNAAGQVAFSATVRGDGITSANNEGLYAGLPGSIFKIVRKGDVIDVDPGAGVDFRTIEAILFTPGSGGGDGLPRAFTDNGMLVYTLRFTDNTSGVFVSMVPAPVPEPAGLLALAGLVTVGTTVVARRRRAGTAAG